MFLWGSPVSKPEPESEPDVEDDDLTDLVGKFFNLGFDELEALGLAWGGASPSAARELLKKGCPHGMATKILL